MIFQNLFHKKIWLIFLIILCCTLNKIHSTEKDQKNQNPTTPILNILGRISSDIFLTHIMIRLDVHDLLFSFRGINRAYNRVFHNLFRLNVDDLRIARVFQVPRNLPITNRVSHKYASKRCPTLGLTDSIYRDNTIQSTFNDELENFFNQILGREIMVAEDERVLLRFSINEIRYYEYEEEQEYTYRFKHTFNGLTIPNTNCEIIRNLRTRILNLLDMHGQIRFLQRTFLLGIDDILNDHPTYTIHFNTGIYHTIKPPNYKPLPIKTSFNSKSNFRTTMFSDLFPILQILSKRAKLKNENEFHGFYYGPHSNALPVPITNIKTFEEELRELVRKGKLTSDPSLGFHGFDRDRDYKPDDEPPTGSSGPSGRNPRRKLTF